MRRLNVMQRALLGTWETNITGVIMGIGRCWQSRRRWRAVSMVIPVFPPLLNINSRCHRSCRKSQVVLAIALPSLFYSQESGSWGSHNPRRNWRSVWQETPHCWSKRWADCQRIPGSPRFSGGSTSLGSRSRESPTPARNFSAPINSVGMTLRCTRTG